MSGRRFLWNKRSQPPYRDVMSYRIRETRKLLAFIFLLVCATGARLGLIIIITIIWTHAWLWTTAPFPMRVMLAPSTTTNGSIVATKRSRKKIIHFWSIYFPWSKCVSVWARVFAIIFEHRHNAPRAIFFYIPSLSLNVIHTVRVFLHELEHVYKT